MMRLCLAGSEWACTGSPIASVRPVTRRPILMDRSERWVDRGSGSVVPRGARIITY